MRKHFLLLTFIFVQASQAIAQITINFPYERTVFQRNNQNEGKIQVTGTFEGMLDRVEGRIVPIIEGQGTTSDWQVIDTSVEFGTYTGFVTGKGGWYSLQVRGILKEQVVFANEISKVGIGEVIIVAGQSNAEGFARYEPNGATDDRVNSLDYQDVHHIEDMPYWGNFSKISRTTKVAPRGDSPWAWGELGDMLVAKLNVPVLFFNVGYEGTSIENWFASSKGLPTVHSGYGFTFPNETPYSYLRICLQNYVARIGVRAILWQQGETDAFDNVPENVYYDKLKVVINTSRKHFGNDVYWAIARTSNIGNVNAAIINAQNRVISDVPNVIPGPETDTIQRWKNGLHFSNENGRDEITRLAKAWNLALPMSFFSASTPYLANPVVEITPSCTSSNAPQLTVDGNYTDFWWNGTKQSRVINANTTTKYQVITRNSTGVYGYSETISPAKLYPATPPVVSAVTITTICPGKSVVLQASPSNVVWNTNATTPTIPVAIASNFFAYTKNSVGCLSKASNTITTTILPKPAKPIVQPLNDTKIVCEGNTIELSLTNDQLYRDITWSNGSKNRTITVSATGETAIFASATELEHGCDTDNSDTVRVKIVTNPIRPLIERNGPLSLQAVNIPTNATVEWFKDGIALNKITPLVSVRETGSYTVKNKVVNEFAGQSVSCLSLPSDAFAFDKSGLEYSLYFYPNPITNKTIYVASVEVAKIVAIDIYDMKGVRVSHGIIPEINDPVAISLKGIPSGIYLLRISYGAYSRTETIFLD